MAKIERNIKWFLMSLWLFGGGVCYAQSHAAINHSRSSLFNTVFVTQAVEGEYGRFAIVKQGQEESDATSEVWRGYGVRNSFGLELLKFIQFSISHTFLNLTSKDEGHRLLNGSRLSGDARLVFGAPVGNMEAGGGFVGSRYDYRDQLVSVDFLGSGYYYSLGVNHYLSHRVSMFALGKSTYEHMVRNGGSKDYKSGLLNTNSISMGFRLWL